MKTMLLAAAAVLTLGVGAAYAGDGEGGTIVAAEWGVQNHESIATSPYAPDFATTGALVQLSQNSSGNKDGNDRTHFKQDNKIPNGSG
jgi:hypothetical protein